MQGQQTTHPPFVELTKAKIRRWVALQGQSTLDRDRFRDAWYRIDAVFLLTHGIDLKELKNEMSQHRDVEGIKGKATRFDVVRELGMLPQLYEAAKQALPEFINFCGERVYLNQR